MYKQIESEVWPGVCKTWIEPLVPSISGEVKGKVCESWRSWKCVPSADLVNESDGKESKIDGSLESGV